MDISQERLSMHRQLLEVEYAEEKKMFEMQTDKTGLHRMLLRGTCWYPISVGRTYRNALDQIIIEVSRRVDSSYEEDDESLFEYGNPVTFFTPAPANPNQVVVIKVKGTVAFADNTRMSVVLNSMDDSNRLAQCVSSLGVMPAFDDYTYKLMFHALDSAINAESGRLKDLRRVFAGLEKPRMAKDLPYVKPYGLNDSQIKAVNSVLAAKDVAIVHGPPGTGKTTTLAETIFETLFRETQVLVCAPSNTAVDNIAEKLIDRGIQVLRIGNSARISDSVLESTYERRFAAHPSYPQLWSIRKAIRQLQSQKTKGESTHQKISSLRDRGMDLEIRIRQEVMQSARVIACTLTGAGHHLLQGMNFSSLFIDEAGQGLEASCWIAILKAGRVVLAGDHMQLPPTVKSNEALRRGLAKTLMETVAESHPDCVNLLGIQYRMAQPIMDFPSRWFYNGQIVAADEVAYHSIIPWDPFLEWKDTSIEDVVDGEEAIDEVTDSGSRINRSEAKLAIRTLRKYIDEIGKDRVLNDNINFGIITPYKAQASLIRQILKSHPFFKQIRRAVTIGTVDGFQGQERDVIIISLVRANPENTIGFLSDLRRMNVAMTRARMKLIIIGNSKNLCRYRFFRELKEFIDDGNTI